MAEMTGRQRSYFAHQRRVAEQEREFTFQEHVGDLAGLGLVDAAWSNDARKPYHMDCRALSPGDCIELASDVDALCGGCGGALGKPPQRCLDGEHCYLCGRDLPESHRICGSCTEAVCESCDVPSKRDDETARALCRPCEVANAHPSIGYSLPDAFKHVARIFS